jgi:RimJ/RimL family protein N-acetyltransferase
MSATGQLDIVARGQSALLRRKRLADARQDFEWQSDPELARLEGRPVLADSYDEFLRRFKVDLEFPPDGAVQLAIQDFQGRHLGNLIAYNFDGGSCEFGLSLGDPEARGQGRGSDAICTFLRWAWASLHVSLVYAHTYEWNQRAQRSLERCGMRAAASTERPSGRLIRYEARREWWLMDDNLEAFPRADGPARPDR